MAIVIDLEMSTSQQDRHLKSMVAQLDRVQRAFDAMNGKLAQMAANMRDVARSSAAIKIRPGSTAPSATSINRIDTALERSLRKFDKFSGAVNRSHRQFERLADASDKIGARLDALNAKAIVFVGNMRAVANASQSVRVPGSGGGGPRTGTNGPVHRHTKPAAPPFDHRAVLSDPGLRSLVMSGDPQAAQLVNRAMAQQRSVARAQGSLTTPTVGQNLTNLLMRSRFGGGGSGGVMPLGMDVAKLFGGSGGAKGAGPIAVALLVAVGAVKAFTWMLKTSTDHLRALNSVLVSGGGTAGTVGAVSRVNAFAGGDVASMVRGRSGLQKGVGMAAGVSPFAGHEFFDPLGANDAAIKLAKHVGKIADTQGREAAMLFAHRAGAAELGKLALLDKGTRERLLSTQASASSDRSMRAGATFDAQMVIFVHELKQFVTTIATPALQLVNSELRKVNGLLKMLAYALDSVNRVLRENPALAGGLFGGGMGIWKDRAKQEEEHDRAMRDHSDAMREHAGILGGGRRTQGSMPRGVFANPMIWNDEAALRHSVRQGAL